jgi:hypothetical protein
MYRVTFELPNGKLVRTEINAPDLQTAHERALTMIRGSNANPRNPRHQNYASKLLRIECVEPARSF